MFIQRIMAKEELDDFCSSEEKLLNYFSLFN